MQKNFDTVKFINDLRNGKKVKCPDCEEGYYITKSNPKTSHCFYCNKCDSQVNID